MKETEDLTKKQMIAEAATDLFEYNSTEDYLQSLEGMFEGYMISDRANEVKNRSQAYFAHHSLIKFFKTIEKLNVQKVA